jgi:hypothetical protein
VRASKHTFQSMIEDHVPAIRMARFSGMIAAQGDISGWKGRATPQVCDIEMSEAIISIEASVARVSAMVLPR